MRLAKSLGLLALCCLPAGLAAQPRPIPRVHYQALCVVDDQGHARCIKVGDLNRILSPDQVQKLLSLMDDLFPQLAGRMGAVRNTLADCSHGNWTRANLTIPATPAVPELGMSGSARKAPAFPSATDVDHLVSQCRSVVQSDFDRAVQSMGGDQGKFISDTVSRMDAAVAQCQDRTSPVASTGASQYVDARSRYNDAVQAVTDKYSNADVRNDTPGARDAYAALYSAATLQKLLDDFFQAALAERDAQDKQETMNFITEVMDGITETLQKIVNPPPASPPPPPPAPGPGTAPAVNPTSPSAVSMPCMGDNCKPTCGQIAAAWDMFKSYCDQSHWKAYQCVAFLAKANNCADPRLIHPSPDGDDMPCPANARVDKWTKMKAAWLDQCRKRQWVMMPSQDGKFLCVAPDFQGMDAPKFDPCNNPKAMPGPDDCAGPVPNPSQPPRPVPKPDPRRPVAPQTQIPE